MRDGNNLLAVQEERDKMNTMKLRTVSVMVNGQKVRGVDMGANNRPGMVLVRHEDGTQAYYRIDKVVYVKPA